ncbi:MAG: class I SAM-dependent methyltransferase [Methanobacteriaceae archaeon]|nr:class I SAM-dependent methyltransferase [Methanobacteriaceae archaeon]
MRDNHIFRDTRDWYLEKEGYASPLLLDFATQNAGKTILDLGCATGEYCIKLEKMGFECTGVDINTQYVEIARKNGVNAVVASGDDLKFADDSFDTVLLFEILEHVENPQNLLKEAKRVAKKNVLITVPNCGQLSQLSQFNLTYEHLLEQDHVNFFTKNDLEDLIAVEFKEFKVKEGEEIKLGALSLPLPLKIIILGLYKIRIIKSNIYYRLYAVAEV